MNKLIVDAASHPYPIYINSGVLTQTKIFQSLLHNRSVCIVTNDTVAPLYGDTLKETLVKASGMANRIEIFVIPDGEQYKTLTTLETIFNYLLKNQFDRHSLLVALGGGVVGDITGFAAACYQRGVEYLQVPTTLLSQVDSSVGGKTAVNHQLGKNMIGAFYQPRAVMIDLDVLTTLPDREYRSGLAEVIKYGAIRDAEFFSWLEANIEALNQRDKKALAYAIERSCHNKAQIVNEDETEAGIRAILNFGHTFAHAFEIELQYGTWLHGEAVSAGMMYAAKLSQQLCQLAGSDVKRLENLLIAAHLPTQLDVDLDIAHLLNHMALDKKNISGSRRMILLNRLGEAIIVNHVKESEIRSVF